MAVGAAMPVTVFVMHRRATSPGAPPFFEDPNWMLVGFAAVLIPPWTAVATVVRPKETFARHQTLAFALERSELECAMFYWLWRVRGRRTLPVLENRP